MHSFLKFLPRLFWKRFLEVTSRSRWWWTTTSLLVGVRSFINKGWRIVRSFVRHKIQHWFAYEDKKRFSIWAVHTGANPSKSRTENIFQIIFWIYPSLDSDIILTCCSAAMIDRFCRIGLFPYGFKKFCLKSKYPKNTLKIQLLPKSQVCLFNSFACCLRTRCLVHFWSAC